MSKKIRTLVGLLVLVSLVLAACTNADAVEETTIEEPAVAEEAVAEVDPMEQLIADAQSEGVLVSYGLPDSWVNYADMKALLLEKYGIETQDTDMGSGEIIAALEAEAGAPVADITDLGLNFVQNTLKMKRCHNHTSIPIGTNSPIMPKIPMAAGQLLIGVLLPFW